MIPLRRTPCRGSSSRRRPTAQRGLVLYWFPASQKELQQSSLRVSRQLSTYASQCVTLEVADVNSVPGQKFITAETQLPVAIIATPDHQLVSKLDNNKGKLKFRTWRSS